MYLYSDRKKEEAEEEIPTKRSENVREREKEGEKWRTGRVVNLEVASDNEMEEWEGGGIAVRRVVKGTPHKRKLSK